MYRYKIYGLILETEIEFRQLMPTSEIDEQRTVRVIEEDVEEEVITRLTEANALECKYTISFDISAFMNKGGYYLIRNGREILFKTKPGYTPETIAVWILGFSLTMALLQRDTIAMHCSALLCDKGALMVVGVPGAGKSSVTRVLIESGFRFLADDVAPIRNVDGTNMVYPAFPYQKLCRNEVEKRNMNLDELIYISSEKDKYLVPVKEIFDENPQPLKCIVMLMAARTDKLVVQRIKGFDTYRVVRENVFLHKLQGAWEGDPRAVNACMKIASEVPVYLIVRPIEKDTLFEIRDEILKIVDEL